MLSWKQRKLKLSSNISYLEKRELFIPFFLFSCVYLRCRLKLVTTIRATNRSNCLMLLGIFFRRSPMETYVQVAIKTWCTCAFLLLSFIHVVPTSEPISERERESESWVWPESMQNLSKTKFLVNKSDRNSVFNWRQWGGQSSSGFLSKP